MSTTSSNLGLVLAEGTDVVDVDTHVAGNFSTIDSKWSSPGTPAVVQVGSSGTPGSSTVVSRSDHIHGITTGTPTSTGTSNSAGSATTVSASDHVHANGTNSVPTAAIQDSAVTTAKINDSAVTTAKVDDGAITTAKVDDGAITTLKINGGAVTTDRMADSAVTTAKIADLNVTRVKLEAIARTLIGGVEMYAGASEPSASGWKFCNGQAISRTTFSELFALIGTGYGTGDGSTTFNLPNMMDRFPVGSGSSYATGATGGAATVDASHTHAQARHVHNVGGHQHSFSSGVSGTSDGPSGINGLGNNGGVSTPTTGHTHGPGSYSVSGTTGPNSDNTSLSAAVDVGTGGSTTLENLPPYFGIRFIIYTGVAS